MLVAMGVVEKDGTTTGQEAKGGPNTSYRELEGASSTTVDSRGIEDSQSSSRLATSLRKGRLGSVSCNKPHSLISITKCACCSLVVCIMLLSLAYDLSDIS